MRNMSWPEFPELPTDNRMKQIPGFIATVRFLKLAWRAPAGTGQNWIVRLHTRMSVGEARPLGGTIAKQSNPPLSLNREPPFGALEMMSYARRKSRAKGFGRSFWASLRCQSTSAARPACPTGDPGTTEISITRQFAKQEFLCGAGKGNYRGL